MAVDMYNKFETEQDPEKKKDYNILYRVYEKEMERLENQITKHMTSSPPVRAERFGVEKEPLGLVKGPLPLPKGLGVMVMIIGVESIDLSRDVAPLLRLSSLRVAPHTSKPFTKHYHQVIHCLEGYISFHPLPKGRGSQL